MIFLHIPMWNASFCCFFFEQGEKISAERRMKYTVLWPTFSASTESSARGCALIEKRACGTIEFKWARRKLVEGGLMFPGPRGLWRLTERCRRKAEVMAL